MLVFQARNRKEMKAEIKNIPNSLIIATRNVGKLGEFQKLLSELPIAITSLDTFEFSGDIEETGNSFSKNADLKASGYARSINEWTLADDSGLEVSALDGQPGIYSARYGGSLSTAERNEQLLIELNKTNSSDRSAQFVCAISISDPSGQIITRTKGICSGKIALKSRGNNGFGYDPVFIPDGFDLTLGELSPKIKQKISHRAMASAIILRYLRAFITG